MKISLPSLIIGYKTVPPFYNRQNQSKSIILQQKHDFHIASRSELAFSSTVAKNAERILKSYFLQTRVGSAKDYNRRVNSRRNLIRTVYLENWYSSLLYVAGRCREWFSISIFSSSVSSFTTANSFSWSLSIFSAIQIFQLYLNYLNMINKKMFSTEQLKSFLFQ